MAEIPQLGDRSAWDVISYGSKHANDISLTTLKRHLPTPGAAYTFGVSDGTNWIISVGKFNIASGKTLTVTGSPTLAGDATLTLTTALTVNTGAGVLTFPAGGATLTIAATGTAVTSSTGTDDYVACFSGASSIVNSLIRDNGTTVSIGDAPNANRYLYVYKIFASASQVEGLRVEARNTSTGSLCGSIYVVRTTDVSANYNTGLQGGSEVYAKTANAAVTTESKGVMGRVQVQAQATFTATISGLAAGVVAGAPFFYAGGGTETITTAHGFYAFNQGAAGVTNAIGLEIASQSGASGTNFAIKTNAGDITFNAGLADAADFLLNGTTYALIQTDASDDELYLCNHASAKLSFHAVTPVVQQVLATGAGKTVDDVITFLQLIGLCKQA